MSFIFFSLIFCFVSLLHERTRADTVLYSSLVADGNRGDRETTTVYCITETEFLNCSDAIALLSYDGDAIKDFPQKWGLDASDVVYGPTRIKIGDNWADSILNADLERAKVVPEGIRWWTGSTSTGTPHVRNCLNWETNVACLNGRSGKDGNYGAGNSACASKKALVCVCMNGQTIATEAPTLSPTTSSPTTGRPTVAPTKFPTKRPTVSPTSSPSVSPTESPTKSPTTSPTESPSQSPTKNPTRSPTLSPTLSPTASPTHAPVPVLASQIAVGYQHTCALLVDGSAECWGNNGESELGNNNAGVSSAVPVAVSGLGVGTVVQIVAGVYHTCALLVDGSAKCWGYDDSGMLGNGASTGFFDVPVSVSGLGAGTVAQIAAGTRHTCALLVDGSVKCWGNNNSGQLGNNNGGVNSNVPVAVTGLGAGTTVQLTAGSSHTCALLKDGSVKCWGNYMLTTLSQVPVAISGLGVGTTVQISGGNGHTCVLLKDGSSKCWGSNNHGQLGNGGTTDSSALVAVSGLGAGTVAQIYAGGYYYSCAVLVDGSAKCWGDNRYGQLGDNNAPTESHVPVAVTGLGAGTVVQIDANGKHACVLLVDGTVKCWGYNNYGELGNNDAGVDSPVPVSVLLGTKPWTPYIEARSTIAGGYHTCALLGDGSAQCWGGNSYGQLGNNNAGVNSPVPVAVTGLGGGTVVQMAGGGEHTCAILVDGSAKCWGLNDDGELGDNNAPTDSDVPVAVTGLTAGTVIQITAGNGHTCALLKDGSAQCWGDNYYGQLGNNNPGVNSAVPVSVSGLGVGTVVQIVAGIYHTCALLVDGSAKCWGYNDFGQLGNNNAGVNSAVPVAVTGLGSGTVVHLYAGGYHTCAVSVDGSAKCWGYNYYGQLGNNNPGTDSPIPVAVSGLTAGTVVQIVIGDYHTCAVLVDGSAKCWGFNNRGQLGNNNAGVNSAVPVAVTGLGAGTTVQITASDSYTCAVLVDGTEKCWGYNNFGQLGYGDTTDRHTPGSAIVAAAAA